jgi:hypothetical protein
MSRSYKKTPISGWCGGSEKEDKQIANRKFRKREHQAIQSHQLERLPHDANDVSNVWSMAKDGKHWISPDWEYFKSGKWKRK